MRRKTRTKLNKIFLIIGIIIGIIVMIIGIIFAIKLSYGPEISYEDVLVGKNYFSEITIDLETKKIRRDGAKTTLKDEFGITEEEENLALSSHEELNNLLSKSSFDISVQNQIYTIKNPYQTKKLIAQAETIDHVVKGEEIEEIEDGIFLLSFKTEKLTKAMFDYYKQQSYIKNIYYDYVYKNKTINEESQTMYGKSYIELNNYHSLGATTLGLDNYHKIINENGNPKEIIISTIGYGINTSNEFFNNRIAQNGYNFILNNNNIEQDNAQSNRITEVLIDSTTPNVKIMPLVVVNDDEYTCISSIAKAICYGIHNSDVICYELINESNDVINLVLEKAFKENKPVCCISSSSFENNYPANHAMTIAVSSLNRENTIADYSSKGDFIDFALPSTDVAEIFNTSSSVSRWSGPQYSNAQIVAEIALIKTYNKEATILEVYNILRNFCIDIGEVRQR